MKQDMNRISWNMLVIEKEEGKKILLPAIKEGSLLFKFNSDDMQIFEDLEGKEYAFDCELATKDSLDYFDRHGHMISTILAYPEVLKKNGLKTNARVSLDTVAKLQKDINALVKEDEAAL